MHPCDERVRSGGEDGEASVLVGPLRSLEESAEEREPVVGAMEPEGREALTGPLVEAVRDDGAPSRSEGVTIAGAIASTPTTAATA